MNNEEVARRREQAWVRFMEAERRELEHRRNGHLRKLLDGPLPGESAEELERLAAEDESRAREGLVELRSLGGEVFYKHIEALSPEDRTSRIRAEGLQVARIAERNRIRDSL